jgi:probable rRNA maturation factor
MRVLIKNYQKLIKISPRKIEKDSLRLLESFDLKGAELGILFVGDSRMKKLNNRYRGVEATTDVLSFPIYEDVNEMPDGREFLLGDIVINLHAARRQSSEHGVTLSEEVRRLLIHGFLHLLGYDHEKNSYQGRKMRKCERELRDAL